jgi:hypothetical protein
MEAKIHTNPVKMQQSNKFTDQLHVSTGHGHHQAGHMTQKMHIQLHWDWDINVLNIRYCVKNIYTTKVDSLGNEIYVVFSLLFLVVSLMMIMFGRNI